MKRLLFASRNEGKIREARAILETGNLRLLSIDDFPGAPDVIEDGDTFLENALKKAEILGRYAGVPAIADDSGLEVDYLGGKPGVHSSRFAGPDASDEDNIRLLLASLQGVPPEKRGAAFRCVLVLYRTDGSYDHCEGALEGSIAMEPAGNSGFGYDSVFLLPDINRTVAQLDPRHKNRISHRARAFEQLRNVMGLGS